MEVVGEEVGMQAGETEEVEEGEARWAEGGEGIPEQGCSKLERSIWMWRVRETV